MRDMATAIIETLNQPLNDAQLLAQLKEGGLDGLLLPPQPLRNPKQLSALLAYLSEGFRSIEDSFQASRLALFCGILVEWGGDAGAVIGALLERMTRHLTLCQRLIKSTDPSEAAQNFLESHPEPARAWLGFAWINMAAMAMLCRDQTARICAREDATRLRLMRELHLRLENGWYVHQFFECVDDFEFTVSLPMLGWSARLRADAVRNNAHLMTLVEGALSEALEIEIDEQMLQCAKALSWEFPDQQVSAALKFFTTSAWTPEGFSEHASLTAIDPTASPLTIPKINGIPVLIVEDRRDSIQWPTALISGLHDAHSPQVELLEILRPAVNTCP